MRVGKILFRACKSSAVFLANAAAFFFLPDDEECPSIDTPPDNGNPYGVNDCYHGVYNFRTGKMDNGTDPYGWYEEDM